MSDSIKNCWLSYIIDDNAPIISSYFPFKGNYIHKLSDDDFYDFFNVSKEEKDEWRPYTDEEIKSDKKLKEYVKKKKK